MIMSGNDVVTTPEENPAASNAIDVALLMMLFGVVLCGDRSQGGATQPDSKAGKQNSPHASNPHNKPIAHRNSGGSRNWR